MSQVANDAVADLPPRAPPNQKSPLDLNALEALKITESYRRRIRHAALLYRFMFVAGLVLVIVMAIAALLMILTAPSSRGAGAAIFTIIVMTAIQIGTVTLAYFAWRSTWDCQRWAPMTMLILHSVGAVFYFLGGLFAAMAPGGDVIAIAYGIVGALIPGIIAILCYRAWSAIPKFLEQPGWCRDALLYCEL